MSVAAPRFPVSIKGVIFVGGRVLLLENERREWELPGGKLESGEDPVDCLMREIAEELSLAVSVERLIDCWLYAIEGAGEVLIVTWGCAPLAAAMPRLSAEHRGLGLFTLDELAALPMPEGYRRSIRRWAEVVTVANPSSAGKLMR